MIVRFYYLWKKTKNGREIWGNFEGRIQKKVQNIIKEETKSAVKEEAKNSTNTEDDSSYEESTDPDDDKKFICKHCNTLESTQWFKITGHDAKKKTQTTTLYLYVLDVLDYGVDTLLFGKTQMKCLKI